MRKLIVQQWVTVDNVAAEEDRTCVPGKRDGSYRLGRHADSWGEYLCPGQGEYGEKLNNLT
jgi:hypothetical protein